MDDVSRPRPTRSGAVPLTLTGALMLLLVAGGCRFARGVGSAGPAAAVSPARPDSAALDSVTPVASAPDSLVADSLARMPDDTPVQVIASVDTAAADSAAETAARDSPARPDSAAADTLLPEGYPSAAELVEMGPTYTEYAIGPRLLSGEWLTNLLSDTLAPVVDRHEELSVQDHALFWVLVDRNGEVRDAVLHTSSESDAFDRAARVVAQRLQFRPAVAEGKAVPVWVLERVSLLMR